MNTCALTAREQAIVMLKSEMTALADGNADPDQAGLSVALRRPPRGPAHFLDAERFVAALRDDSSPAQGTPDSGVAHSASDQRAIAPQCVSGDGAAPADQRVTAAPMIDGLYELVAHVYTENHPDPNRGGARAVHVALDDRAMPQTRVSIYETAGRLAVMFVSRDAATRARLRGGAPALARRIADTLRRDVMLKVAACAARDLTAVEVRADAPADTRADALPIPTPAAGNRTVEVA